MGWQLVAAYVAGVATPLVALMVGVRIDAWLMGRRAARSKWTQYDAWVESRLRLVRWRPRYHASDTTLAYRLMEYAQEEYDGRV